MKHRLAKTELELRAIQFVLPHQRYTRSPKALKPGWVILELL